MLPRWPSGLTRADGAGPAQFMAEQFARSWLRPRYGPRPWRESPGYSPGRARRGPSHNRRPDSRRRRRSRRPRPGSGARERDGGTEAGRGQAQRGAQHHIGQESHRTCPSPPASTTACGRPCAGFAGIKAGDEADAGRASASVTWRQPARRHGDIAVRQHQRVVPRRGQHVDQVGNLGIGAIAARASATMAVSQMRIVGLQRAHHRDGRIGFVMHAEHDLHRAGIILGEEAFQIVATDPARPDAAA